jgi:TRAP-type mannitol/chloroaromatic compound transport system permease small subunit
METTVDVSARANVSKAASFAKWVDGLNEAVGKWISYLIIPLTFIVFYEVILRYIFNAPTLWAWDVNMYLGGLMLILGGGYGHLHKAHVLVEVFLEKMSPKQRALLDLIASPLIFFPLAILVWYGWESAWHSIVIKENYTSLWEPPIYYLRMAIPVGGALFLLQAISRFISDLAVYRQPARKGEKS